MGTSLPTSGSSPIHSDEVGKPTDKIGKPTDEVGKPTAEVGKPTVEIGAEIGKPTSQVSKLTTGIVTADPTHKKLDAFEDRISTAYGIYTDTQTVLTGAKAVLDAVAVDVDLSGLEDRVKGFAESSKVVMTALDAVAQVHPFVGIAVMAFKAVVNLELKRRDNDRKVIALMLRMQEMMSVLGELCNIRDLTQKAPDGTTLPGRMQALMARVAQNIKSCGNACDGYAKKHLIVKIVKSSKYEERMAEFAVVFDDRRNELELALSMHTTLAIDAANRTLADVNAKMDMIVSFQKLYSPQEKAAQKLVKENGGIHCIDDDGVLNELYLISESTDRDAGSLSLARPKKLDSTALIELRKALNEDVDTTLKKNLILFGAKFRMQVEELGQSVKTAVESGTEQLLDAMGRRLHSRIIDPDLHRVWVDMDWKGSVKARHFVLALHDYFWGGFKDHEASSESDDQGPSTSQPPIAEEDRWALPYINILHVQPIMEAIDDDGTGFISIKEANLFTTSRPKQWSLPQRLAYWAAGWRYTIHQYSLKIAGIIENMFDRLSSIPPENRKIIDLYLHDRTSFRNIELLMRSLNSYRDGFDPALNARFRPYVQAEESRMEHNLQSVGYEIDDANTMQLVLGPGRIEQYLFPFLFLVLRRHLQLVKIAGKHILHQDELKTATRSLRIIFEVVQARMRNIAALFQQKNLDVSTQLRTFAYGMFRLLNDSEGLEGPKLFETPIFGHYNDEDEPTPWRQQELDTSILKYGIQRIPLLFDRSPYEIPEPSSKVADLSLMSSDLPRIAGIWTGYFFDWTHNAHGLTMIIVESITNDGQFQGRGEDGEGSVFTKYGDFTGGGVFTVAGEITAVSNSTFQVSFTKDYNPDSWADSTLEVYCEGKLDLRSRTISGEWANPIDNHTNTFEIGQTPVFAYRFRYSQETFRENAPRARWSFACASILQKVRQELWSWTYFRARFADQRRFMELWRRQRRGNRHLLSQDGLDEFKRIERRLSPADCRFYDSVNQAKWRNINRSLSTHLNVYCASCNDGLYIMGTRIICLTCTVPDLIVQVNLCINCIGTTPAVEGFQHETVHPVIKVQRMVHDREMAKLVRRAKTALDMCKVVFGAEKLSFDWEVKRCSGCQKMLTGPPCWYCLTCYPHHLICEDCESKQRRSSREEHNSSHPVVRCQPDVVVNEIKTLSVEDRLTTLENATRERLDRLEQAWGDHKNMVNGRFTGLDVRMTEVQDRLTTMESLLRMVAAKVLA